MRSKLGGTSGALGVGSGVGFFVGFGVARRATWVGFGLAAGFGFGLAVGLGFGFTDPHLSAKITVHIFLPLAPLYAPMPMTSQFLPRMFERCPAEFMKELWILPVAVESLELFQPMFSPATWKQKPRSDMTSNTRP
jgi:hypothetical protein